MYSQPQDLVYRMDICFPCIYLKVTESNTTMELYNFVKIEKYKSSEVRRVKLGHCLQKKCVQYMSYVLKESNG